MGNADTEMDSEESAMPQARSSSQPKAIPFEM